MLKEFDFGAAAKSDDIKDSKVHSNREFYEREMKEVQQVWVNRIHKLFYLFIGLLAGMSLMHLLIIMTPIPSKL